MVSIKNLHFSYNESTEFQFPDMNCSASETLLITGNSGKGKTTLLHLVGGLLRAKSGEVSIDGKNISVLSEKELDNFRGKNIGLVLQQSHFVASLNVLENVVLASWLATGKKATEKAKSLLKELDLEDQQHKLPSSLSMGQQQRVSIARALANKPPVILADEPTAPLDSERALGVMGILNQMASQYQTAIIVVTHDEKIIPLFKRIYAIRDGQTIEESR